MATTSEELPPEEHLRGRARVAHSGVDDGTGDNGGGAVGAAVGSVHHGGPIGDPLAMDPDAIDRLSTLAHRRARPPGAPLAVAAAVAALWAALTSFVPALALLLATGIGSSAGVPAMIRLAGSAWLLANGVPVHTPADEVSLTPLALTALVGWRLVRAGVHASRAVGGHRRRSPGRALAATAVVALAYAVLGLVVAAVLSTTDVWLSPLRAAWSLGLFALGTAGAGALGASRAGRALRRRAVRAGVTNLVAMAVRTGACAAALMLAAGAGVAGLALACNGGEAASMLASYQAGTAGQAGITALCLAFAPNVAVWGMAYLLGPGFAVGTDTLVSPGAVLIGPLPGLPVLAGLPSVPLTGLGPALLGLPVLAAICAGVLLARRGPASWPFLLATAALSGVFGGALVQVAGYAAAGALGSGRLARFGAVDWRVGAIAAGVTAVGALIGAAGMRVLARP